MPLLRRECRSLPILDVGLILLGAATIGVLTMAHRRKTGAEFALQHPVRRSVLDMVLRRPGVRLSSVWKSAGVDRRTARYHLTVLERIGAVQSVKGDRSVRYFPASSDAERLPAVNLLLRGRVMEVASAIQREPGLRQQDITSRLTISRKVFRDYADRLTEQGLLREVTDSRTRRYYPTDRLGPALDAANQAQGRVAPE